MKILGFVFIICTAVQSMAERPAENYLNNFLKLMERDSYLAMSLVPPKYNQKGEPVFSKVKIPIGFKDQFRQRFCSGAFPGESCQSPRLYPMAEIKGDSDLKNFFYRENIQTNIQNLLREDLNSARSKVTPWSGDYWPTYQAGIAARYKSNRFPASGKFEKIIAFYEKHWRTDLNNKKEVENLSPAEKYDLLMGLPEKPLTLSILADAMDTYNANDKKIETWFGICHGWAPASFMLERPVRAIEVESIIPKLKIKFYPDDIKALASHLWANTTLQSRTMGGRCDDKDPKKDEKGRIISEQCYDINPGAWHLAVINQIGLNQGTFVLDATYDQEVWNQPVVSYKLNFFNVIDKKVADLKSAMVEISSYTGDIFNTYRSPHAKFIVGVSMELTYVSETSASGDEADSVENDNLKTVQYIYDLEIDETGEIIGGEWYQNAHPDFLWAPGKNARAVSVVERELKEKWMGAGSPPQDWKDKAAFAAKYSQPLASVVENLIRLAQ